MNATLRTRTRRVVVGLAVAGAAVLAVGAPAAATPSTISGTPSATDLGAGHRAADTPAVHKLLAGFFADRGRPAVNRNAAHRAAVAATMDPTLATTVPVYYLNPDFVAAGTGDAPVAKLAYLATDAVSLDGQHATVWTVRDAQRGNAWTEVNIASGSDEVDYAAQAGTGTAFREPQINAWYAVRDGRVLPLNEIARKSVGAHGVTLAAYRTLVHQRYADKMAGSTYARKHTVGGNWLPRAATPAPVQHSVPPVGYLLAGIALAGLAGAMLLRRVAPRLVSRLR